MKRLICVLALMLMGCTERVTAPDNFVQDPPSDCYRIINGVVYHVDCEDYGVPDTSESVDW